VRLIIRSIRQRDGKKDHREFDDFRDCIVHDLGSEDFMAFWTKLAPPPPSPPSAVDPAALLISRANSRHLLTLLSALCVT